jgi:hypothetical protein
MIVSSSILEDAAQADGSRHVVELHVFDDGHEVRVGYVAENKIDADAYMLARVPFLEAQRTAEVEAAADGVLIDSISDKETAYLDSLSDAELKSEVGLTDEEVALKNESKPP